MSFSVRGGGIVDKHWYYYDANLPTKITIAVAPCFVLPANDLWLVSYITIVYVTVRPLIGSSYR
jgi:hypothetical protein